MKKLTWKTGGLYDSISYIDGIFEYVKLEDGTEYEKNYVHIMDDSSRIAEVRINIGTAFPNDIADDRVYTLEDQIGSSVVRLDTNGTIIDKEEYYPFGDSSLRTFTYKRYRYVGKERDAESGLYYYGARYYAAWTCRFISVDPLAAKYNQLTPYNYAGNNPINDKDIDGMQSGKTPKGGDSSGNKGESAKGGGSEAPKPEVHNVKKGETLSGIAKEHGTTVEKLRESNNLNPQNDRKLQIGTKLNIPGTESQAGVGTSASASVGKPATTEAKNPDLQLKYSGLEGYREWQKNPNYNQGETKMDRIFRLIGASHTEIMLDFGGGGYNMNGGYGAARVVGAMEKGATAMEEAFTVNPSKFEYFFGRVVTGSEHNISRSAQNLKDLTQLGIKTEEQLMGVFSQAMEGGTTLSTKTSQYGTTIVKSVNVGEKGSVMVGFFYSGGNMGAKPSVVTIIPKIFK